MTRTHTNTTKWVTAELAVGVSRAITAASAFDRANTNTVALAKVYVR
jgi:hypothetical protein